MGMPKSPCNRPSVSGGSRGLGIWARLWNNHGVCQSCLVWKWGIPRNGDILLREFEVPKLAQSLWKLKCRKACWRKSHVNGNNIYSMSRNRCNIKAKNRTRPNRVGQVGCNWKWGTVQSMGPSTYAWEAPRQAWQAMYENVIYTWNLAESIVRLLGLYAI